MSLVSLMANGTLFILLLFSALGAENGIPSSEFDVPATHAVAEFLDRFMFSKNIPLD